MKGLGNPGKMSQKGWFHGTFRIQPQEFQASSPFLADAANSPDSVWRFGAGYSPDNVWGIGREK